LCGACMPVGIKHMQIDRCNACPSEMISTFVPNIHLRMRVTYTISEWTHARTMGRAKQLVN
jgi:hypothetical protein